MIWGIVRLLPLHQGLTDLAVGKLEKRTVGLLILTK